MPRYYVRWIYEDGGDYIVDAPDPDTAMRAVSDRIDNSDYAGGGGETTYICSGPISDNDDDRYMDYISCYRKDDKS